MIAGAEILTVYINKNQGWHSADDTDIEPVSILALILLVRNLWRMGLFLEPVIYKLDKTLTT